MSKFDVRERDLTRLREVVAALRAPPAAVTPDPNAVWGAPAQTISHDPDGPGVRWRALDELRDLLNVTSLVLNGMVPGQRSWFFGQRVGPDGPEDFWLYDLWPGGPPDTDNDLPDWVVECENRHWDAFHDLPLSYPHLASDYDVVLSSDMVGRKAAARGAALLSAPLCSELVTVAHVGGNRRLEICGAREGWAPYTERERGFLELLKPHVVNAWRASCVAELPVTAAQLRVLERVRDGSTNRQVARDLGITEATVRTHLQNAYEALGVDNRVAAVAAAFGSPGAAVPTQRREAAS